MSHFTVLVVGDVESQLAPFNENMEVPAYPKYTREFATNKLAEEIARYEKIVAENDEGRYNIPACIEYLEKYRKYTPEEYFKYLCEDYENFDADGNPLTTYNPKSKWDWYSKGGRWGGFFTLKDGTKADKAKKKDIDFDAMIKKCVDNASKNWDAAVNECGTDSEKDVSNRYWLYDIKDEDWKAGKDAYIAKTTKGALHTFAVVKDGEWYERGEMGWFATVSNEKAFDQWIDEFESLLKSVKDDEILTLVDCHI
jgi:hypothetical protein